MRGHFIGSTDRQLIGGDDKLLWLLRDETESEITAAQNEALQNQYHATNVLQTETDSKCRLCQQFDESVTHITSACPI